MLSLQLRLYCVETYPGAGKKKALGSNSRTTAVVLTSVDRSIGMKRRFVIQDIPQSLSSLQELGQALQKETGEQMLNLP